ncbi:MAG: histidine phosphatase family protein [Candidatus Hodarchaeales archaeon]
MVDLSKIPDLELYFVRHADPEKVPNSWTSPEATLSKIGELQAERLGEHLSKVEFNRIISSTLPRAKQTANILIKRLQFSVEFSEHSWLNEINLGNFGGKTTEKLRRLYPEYFSKVNRDPDKSLVANLMVQNPDFRFPGGESVEEFWSRVSTNFSLFLESCRAYSTVGIVAHGGSLTVMMLLLMGITFTDTTFPTFKFEKANYLSLRIKSGRLVILSLNPLNHNKH